MFENIDPYWIALMLILTGGVAAVIIPYLGKLYDEGTQFNVTYFIPLCFTVLIGAIALVPSPVPELTPQILTSFFVMGFGLQSGGNFLTTRLLKR